MKGRVLSASVLFTAVALGYAQVTFGLSALKWDLIDVVFPFRYFFSESFGAGYFPFWNPFQQTGTPFYADLQAPTYYPELWLVSLLGGYSVYTMHLLMILYLFLAALGMYALIRDYTENEATGLFAGLAYAFSGFMVGHGQHFFLIVGAAWIPFVIRSYLAMCQSYKLTDAIRSAVFTFLLLTGAYQALSLVMFYVLVGIFIYTLVGRLRMGSGSLELLKANALFAILTVLMCLPLINATAEIIPLVERLSGGVDLDHTLRYGQPAAALLSFVAPYATVQFDALFGDIDKALLNHYVGLIPLMFFLLALTKREPGWMYLFLLFGLLIFSMSFSFLPIRQWVYALVPFMDLFLLAAYIRIFGLMAIVVVAAKYFSQLERYIDRDRLKLIGIAAVLLVGLVVLVWANHSGLLRGNMEYELPGRLIKPVVFSTIILLATVLVLWNYRSIGSPKTLLLVLLLADLIAAAQWNMDTTVTASDHSPSAMQDDLRLAPKGFPVPVNSKVVFNDEQHAFVAPFWRNTYIFSKQVSFESFSSFKLRTYSLLDQNPNLRNAVIDNHLVFLSDTIGRISDFEKTPADYPLSSALLLFEDADYEELLRNNLRASSHDDVAITEFTPNRVSVKAETEFDQVLTLLQTNFTGWRAYIDGEEVAIRTSNYNYRSILLPAGKHEVVFKYSNPRQLFFYFFSSGIFALLVLWLMVGQLRGVSEKRFVYLGVPGFLVAMLFIFAATNIKRPSSTEPVQKQNRARFGTQVVREWHQDFEGLTARFDSSHSVSGLKSLRIDPETETYPILKYSLDNESVKGNTLFIELELYVRDYPSSFLVSEIAGNWHALPLARQVERLNSFNTIQYMRRIPELDKGEEVKVYLWNPKGDTFFVDDASVSFSKY